MIVTSLPSRCCALTAPPSPPFSPSCCSLFDKGTALGQPEIVPFRLTPYILDGLGICGYEGVFRRVSEVSMEVLREHKELLLSSLESFVHDPLVEWSKAGHSTSATAAAGQAKGGGGVSTSLAMDPSEVHTAAGAESMNLEGVKMLYKVRARLCGEYNNGAQYVSLKEAARRQAAQAARVAQAGQAAGVGVPLPGATLEPTLPSNALEVRGQVHRLIKEASCDENLSAMYIGWMPFL